MYVDDTIPDGPQDENEQDPVAESEALSAQNDEALKALAQQGIKVEQVGIVAARVMALCDRLLGPMRYPNGELNPVREQFELELQRGYAEQIQKIQSEVTRAVLLNGVRGVG